MQALGRPALQCRQGLIAGNRQKPGRDLGSASNLPACRQTSKNTSLTRSSPVRDKAEEETGRPARCGGQTKVCIACLSPAEIEGKTAGPVVPLGWVGRARRSGGTLREDR